MTDITTPHIVEQEPDRDAIALATVIFAAGFFLGIGTGMLFGANAGSGGRERIRRAMDHLVGDTQKELGRVLERGLHFLTKDSDAERR